MDDSQAIESEQEAVADPHRGIAIVAIPLLLKAFAAPGQVLPTARHCYTAALDARLPGVFRTPTGRWRVPLAALPEIATMFGLTGGPAGSAGATGELPAKPQNRKQRAPDTLG